MPPALPPADCARPPPPGLDADSRARLPVLRTGFVSRGHAGGLFAATIRASAGATEGHPAGALLVAEHERADGLGPGPVLAMQRRARRGDPARLAWCYFVAEPDGTLLRDGELGDCAGCHAAAPRDSVFTALP